ncbi:hypothetical protein BGX23_008426 [Mortierella sp. AD031]|nr:hypothetical protein BGX23_008426 [Mortierella sp. AD031]
MEINPAITFKHDRTVMYSKKPKVLIVGAGIGDIPYEIFERAAEVKPLEFRSLSRELSAIHVANEERGTEFFVSDIDDPVTRYGAENRIIARPKLYDLLLRQVPKERIHMSKKVQSTHQGGNGVLISCSDGSEYEGDILVGADGAYSAVRQNLYAQLKKDKKLPPSDSVPLPFTNVCLVGQTKPLTVEEFPDLEKATCQFNNILSKDKPYACMTFTTQQNTVCYAVVQYLNEETSKENDAFRQSEWGQEAATAMCKELCHFPIISGSEKPLTLGDLFDWSPKEYISKVMLEEKVFKTWYHCRTVLIGDACHKLNPSGDQGAVNAIHDAIVLANYLFSVPDHPIAGEIEAAFKEYKDERIEWVETAFNTSQLFRNMVDKVTMKAAVQPSLNAGKNKRVEQEEGKKKEESNVSVQVI